MLKKLIGVALCCVVTNLYASQHLDMQATVQAALPAIVNVQAEHPADPKVDGNSALPTQDLPDDLKPKDGAIGSGVIISKKNGIIVTNDHVVDKAKAVIVTLNDGERLLAKVIGKDKDYDLAVLAIDTKRLHGSKIADLDFDDSDKLHVGQTVIAIGSPYGLSQSVTTGIVSALNRSAGSLVPYASFIQTDAPINPGNSGGALLDTHGKLIGINTAIMSPTHSNSGIGFAIPSNLVKAVAMQILQNGKVNQGVLGVMVQNLTPSLRSVFNYHGKGGVLVANIVPNTPAAKANMQNEDILLTINGEPMHDTKMVQDTIRLMAPGSKVRLKIWHDGKMRTASVRIGDPKKIKAAHINHLSGMRLQDVTEQDPDGSYYRGVLVVGMRSTSAGNVANLGQGDIIVAANQHATPNIAALEKISNQVGKRDLLLKVRRDKGAFFVVVPFLG